MSPQGKESSCVCVGGVLVSFIMRRKRYVRLACSVSPSPSVKEEAIRTERNDGGSGWNKTTRERRRRRRRRENKLKEKKTKAPWGIYSEWKWKTIWRDRRPRVRFKRHYGKQRSHKSKLFLKNPFKLYINYTGTRLKVALLVSPSRQFC